MLRGIGDIPLSSPPNLAASSKLCGRSDASNATSHHNKLRSSACVGRRYLPGRAVQVQVER
jgi:hypothetical protein